MLDGLYSALPTAKTAPANETIAPPRKVLRMVKSERMGGSMPVWETAKPPETEIEKSLTHALNNASPQAPEAALAYNAEAGTVQATAHNEDDFGFGDLVDMVNPLHHIPVVGHVYREITGDQIKPIGNIIGGAVFGGPLGAASGLINAIVIEETGKDLTGNAMALAFNGEMPSLRNGGAQTHHDDPETRLASAATNAPATNTSQSDLPGNLLAFADLKSRPDIVIKRIDAADGRTAGSFTKTSYPKINENSSAPIREPITQVRFSATRITD